MNTTCLPNKNNTNNFRDTRFTQTKPFVQPEINSGVQTLPRSLPAAVRLKEKPRTLRFLQAFIMFHFCHSLFSRSLRRVCFARTRQQRHATLNLRWFPRRLLALSPSESPNDRCYLHDSNLLQSGETYLPDPRWLFRIVDVAGQISAPSPGLDTLFSRHHSLSKANISSFP